MPLILNVQKNGAILVAGRIGDQNSGKFLLTRFKATGRVDATFGDRGSAQSDFEYNANVAADGGPVSSTPVALVTQPDGQVILGGDVDSATYRYGGAVRFDRQGNINILFGNHGDFVADKFGQNGYYSAMLRQANGKLVFIGHNTDDSILAPDFAFTVGRYDTQGNIDLSFATTGATAFHFTTNPSEHAAALCGAIQADGKIVIGGFVDASNSGHTQLALLRLNTDGSLDSSFGIGGEVLAGLPGNNQADSITIQHGGGLIVSDAGHLLRFNRNGRQDVAFGGSAAGHFSSTQVVQQPDGKLLCLGNRQLARFNTDGTADVTFGENGVAPMADPAIAIALTPAGEIMTAGVLNNRLVLNRYQGTTPDSAGNTFSAAKPIGGLRDPDFQRLCRGRRSRRLLPL